nr:DNA-directed RNA polymerase subunit omega [Cryptomonas borealis]
MKNKQTEIESLEILCKTEELVKTSCNKYKVTMQIANEAKRKKYDDVDNVSNIKGNPIVRVILEMTKKDNSNKVTREDSLVDNVENT